MSDPMRIDVIREHILEAVQLCSQVIKKTDPIAAYQCIRMEVKDGTMLQVAGLSREITIMTSISARVVHAGDPVAVHADRLLAHLDAIPENETVRISTTENRLLKLVAAKHNTKMNLLDWQLLPVHEIAGETEFGLITEGEEGVFRGAYATDSNGPLSSVRMDLRNGTLVLSGANPYRIASMSVDLGLPDTGNTDEVVIGIPRETATLVAKVFKGRPIRVSGNNNHIAFTSGDIRMTCLTTATPPPDFLSRIVWDFPTWLTMPTRLLRKEVKAAKAACDGTMIGVMKLLPASNRMLLSAANPGYGDTCIEVDGVGGQGEDTQVGINLGYLDDALAQVTGDAAILQISADRNMISLRPQFGDKEHHVICAMRS